MAEHDEVRQALQRVAVLLPVPAADSLSALEAALPDAPPQIGIFKHDWAQFHRVYPIAASPRFVEFAAAGRTAPGPVTAGSDAPLRIQLTTAPPEKRPTLLESALRGRISKIMGFSGAKLETAQPLVMLGLDSLMAIELRTWIQAELGHDVPIMTLLGGATVAQLVTELSGHAETGNGEMPAGAIGPMELEEIRL
jgi:phthiocerol/phenolphthiocerol synthesis type-I polyketide synthase D